MVIRITNPYYSCFYPSSTIIHPNIVLNIHNHYSPIFTILNQYQTLLTIIHHDEPIKPSTNCTPRGAFVLPPGGLPSRDAIAVLVEHRQLLAGLLQLWTSLQRDTLRQKWLAGKSPNSMEVWMAKTSNIKLADVPMFDDTGGCQEHQER